MPIETERISQERHGETRSEKGGAYELHEESLEAEVVAAVAALKAQDSMVGQIERDVSLGNPEIVAAVKEDLNLAQSLQDINNEADAAKEHVLATAFPETSFWKNGETIEQKIEKIEEIFSRIDFSELEREDVESLARGYNVTHHAKEIESFKKDLIRHISGEKKFHLEQVPGFEKLIDQKEFQDLVWLSAGVDIHVILMYHSNEKCNALIQERPEFLESAEFRKIRLQCVKDGIENLSLFEGYSETLPVTFSEEKVDFFNRENAWGSLRSSFDVGPRVKRENLDDLHSANGKPWIVNLESYKYAISAIDELSPSEKEEVRTVFMKQLSRGKTYSQSLVFGDALFDVAQKLAVSREDVHRCAHEAMFCGLAEGIVPGPVLGELPVVGNLLKESLSDQKKRQELLVSLGEGMRQKDVRFDHWKGALEYLALDEAEQKAARRNYLDFSGPESNLGGADYDTRQDEIFPRWDSRDASLNFSDEDRLFAFSTMDSNQRAFLASRREHSPERLQGLPFTQEDLIAFGAASIDRSESYFGEYAIGQAQEKIRRVFPSAVVEDADIKKRHILQNNKKIGRIAYALQANSLAMSPSEIVAQYDSPEEFVRTQIKDADLQSLINLETFKQDPDAPELPALPKELYEEIKRAVISRASYSFAEGDQLKKILEFVPRQYKMELLTDPEWQKAFSDLYEQLLRNNNSAPIKDLSFFIASSEGVRGPERKVFEEYMRDQNLRGLLGYYETLRAAQPSSPTFGAIGDFLKERLVAYGVEKEIVPSHPGDLRRVFFGTCEKRLKALGPEHPADGQLMKEWIDVVHEGRSEELFRAFSVVKDSKSFASFEKDIVPNLFQGASSELFVSMLQEAVASDPSSVDRVIAFADDIRRNFGTDFMVHNYAILREALPLDNDEQYAKNVAMLGLLYRSNILANAPIEKKFAEALSYGDEDQKTLIEMINPQAYADLPESTSDWAKNVVTYVNDVEECDALSRNEKRKTAIVELFSGDYKNVALREMSAEWKKFLAGGARSIPPRLKIATSIIDRAGGAGNMKHLESLGNLVFQMQVALENKKTVESTKADIASVMAGLESRFQKEHWSQDDISECYNLSRDILEAAPSLYASLGPVFENISSAKSMKKFMSDVFPFYQAQLVIQQRISGESVTYDPKSLVAVRNGIREFAASLGQGGDLEAEVLESEKMRLLEVAREGFKDRFGLLKVPESFTKENLRSIQNAVRYMGNISNRTPQRESLISLYVGLELDGKWADFRGGKDIDFAEYLSERHLQAILPILEKKKESYAMLSDIAGVDMAEMESFQQVLQEDMSNNMVGDMQTIDIKLGNVKRNIDDLVDPDIYQTAKEKGMLRMFSSGGKQVNTVLSKLYGIATGKNIALSEEERAVREDIEQVFGVTEWTAGKVKEIQDESQPMSLVVGMVNKMQEEQVEKRIEDLQASLVPNDRVIDIFKKLGEEFRQESGAFALSKDLSYLEGLIVKGEKKIAPEEKDAVISYIGMIREKMKDMEHILDRVKQHFEKVKKSSHTERNPVLKNRMADIEKVIYSQEASAVITSHLTKDLNLVIENMRQCLGCMRKEINNDTNLSFGDYNKFFLMNSSEKEKGSISDEIVFFVPVTIPNGTPEGSKEMSFVMDRVYGSKSSDVLTGNIVTVYKKYQSLKRAFPDARLSLTVTNAAMVSVGVDAEILEKRVREAMQKDGQKDLAVELFSGDTLVATIPNSALGDNYVEFGQGYARQSGDRGFSGLILR